MYVSYSNWLAAPRPVDCESNLFAIGDIHGHANELLALHEVIRREIAANPDLNHQVIHLGDYIDRGPESRKVLEILASGIGIPIKEVFLVGNHDQFLRELLNLNPDVDKYFINNWYENGGIATMRSLGVDGYGRLIDSSDLGELRARTIHALGEDLVEFLYSLETIYQDGEYVFVHAGIDPRRNISDQEFADLLLVREPFLSSEASWKHSFCVVHGHSVSAPAVCSHRISVDAGCYRTGALCAAHISQEGVRFVAVTREASRTWLEYLGLPASGWFWSEPSAV